MLIYSPDGQLVDRIIFHEIIHVTVGGDTVKADVEMSHFSLSCDRHKSW